MAKQEVDVSPDVLRWARERSGRSLSDLKRFPVEAWENRTVRPTMRQLEDYAKATRTAVGSLFLSQPPEVEKVPIPDFRTFGGTRGRAPTPDLLDTIYACQQRQDWYRDFADATGADAVPLVGAVSLDDEVDEAADAIRNTRSTAAGGSTPSSPSVAGSLVWHHQVELLIRRAGLQGLSGRAEVETDPRRRHRQRPRRAVELDEICSGHLPTRAVARS